MVTTIPFPYLYPSSFIGWCLGEQRNHPRTTSKKFCMHLSSLPFFLTHCCRIAWSNAADSRSLFLFLSVPGMNLSSMPWLFCVMLSYEYVVLATGMCWAMVHRDILSSALFLEFSKPSPSHCSGVSLDERTFKNLLLDDVTKMLKLPTRSRRLDGDVSSFFSP